MSSAEIILCMLLVIILAQLINALIYSHCLNSHRSNKEFKDNLAFLKKLRFNKKTDKKTDYEQTEKPNWQKKF
jgi:hypothetical protein